MRARLIGATTCLLALALFEPTTFGQGAGGQPQKKGPTKHPSETAAVHARHGTNNTRGRVVVRGVRRGYSSAYRGVRRGRSGRYSEVVQGVQLNQLPRAVVEAAMQVAPAVRFTRFVKHTNRGSVYYEVDGRDGFNNRVTLRISPSGKVLNSPTTYGRARR